MNGKMSSGELSERGSTAPLRRRPSRWTHMSRRPWSPVAVAREASRRPPPLPKAPRERGPRSCGGERSHMRSYVFLSNIDHMWFFFSGGQGHHRASAIARGRSCCCLHSEWDRKCEKKAGLQRSAAPLRSHHNGFVNHRTPWTNQMFCGTPWTCPRGSWTNTGLFHTPWTHT